MDGDKASADDDDDETAGMGTKLKPAARWNSSPGSPIPDGEQGLVSTPVGLSGFPPVLVISGVIVTVVEPGRRRHFSSCGRQGWGEGDELHLVQEAFTSKTCLASR